MSDARGPGGRAPRVQAPSPMPAERFVRPHLAVPRRHPVTAVASGLALVVLVLGVPAALLWLAGVPSLPSGPPGRDLLTRPVGIDLLLDVLLVVTWLAWAQFTVSVLVEARAALRGGGLAPRLPLAGPTQHLARTLVAAVLLGSTVMVQAAAAMPALAPLTVSTQTTQQGVVAGDAGTTFTVGTPATPVMPAAAGSAAAPVDAAALPGALPAIPTTDDAALVGRRVYMVVPPEGRYHDNLWDIAERHLGDGFRYKEIYELNKDRDQPGGGRLEMARLIHPGWLLVMPEDAVDVPRWQAPPASITAPPAGIGAPAPASDPASDRVGADTMIAPPPAAADAPVKADVSTADAGQAARVTARDAFTGSTLLAVGLVLLLARRRRAAGGGTRPATAEAAFEVALRLRADTTRVDMVNRGLRMLPHRGGGPGPVWYAAAVDDDGLTVYLSPRDRNAPPPWETTDGSRWHVPAAGLPRRVPDDIPVAPLLVAIGQDDAGADVLVDLAASGGTVAIGGSALAAEVATSMACELSLSPWAAAVDILVWGLGQAPGALSAGVVVLDDPEDALAHLPARRDDLVSGGSMGPRGSRPRVILIGPGAPVASVRRIAARAGAGVTVVIVDSPVPANWAATVDDAGLLHVPAIGISVTAARMPDAAAERVRSLLRSAEQVPSLSPDDDPVPPPPFTAFDDAALLTAPARVMVLGAVSVRAPGTVDEDRLDLVTEIVTYLALHPGGVHPSVLAASVWPLGVTAAVRDAAVERCREWLGTDEAGRWRLGTDSSERLILRDTAVDLDVLHRLLGDAARARSAGDSRSESDRLRRTLRLVRGEPLAPRPARRYSWLALLDVEHRTVALVTAAAHRLACLEREAGDDVASSEAARAGLRADALAGRCWQDLLSAEHAIGARPAVAETVHGMRREFAAAGVPVPADVEALVAELHPALAVTGA